MKKYLMIALVMILTLNILSLSSCQKSDNGYNGYTGYTGEEGSYNHDTRVKVGMSRSQIEKIWGSPYMSKTKSAGDGYVIYCWYYDSYGENRVVIYYSSGVAGSITPDYAELEKYFD